MIMDGTYHEMLHVDWLRADINGDGVAEYVPRSERAGKSEPQRAYLLFSQPTSPSPPPPSGPEKPGFYVGGNIYRDWATVPARYKAEDPHLPDARRSTASIFRITW